METQETINTTEQVWLDLIHQLGQKFEKNSPDHDQNDAFVRENYHALQEQGFFKAMIPEELGGYGLSHQAMCDVIRTMAQYCSSTALAHSMHQHLLAANIWKYNHGKGGEAVLKKTVEENLILISTGARDWLESNGTMEKAKGGYYVSGQKHFASQTPMGNILVTSAPYKDPEEGNQVLHFSIPMNAEGINIKDNWYTMGMRGTGSQTIVLDKVFVPEEAIVLRRPQGTYHLFWNVVLTVALPLIMAVYVGIAEKAVKIVMDSVKNQKDKNPLHAILTGEVFNQLRTAQITWRDMVRLTNNFEFKPTDEMGNEMLIRKSLVANATAATVSKAMEITGGKGYFRKFPLEKLFRDVQAGFFHPLPEKKQLQFTGEMITTDKLSNFID